MSELTGAAQDAPVQIRVADESDSNLLARLGAITFQETFAAENTPEDMAAYLAANFTPEKLSEELADPANRFLLAKIDGSEAGYAKLRAGEALPEVGSARPVELSRIYVARTWLRRGVGQALMQRCIDEALSDGADVLWLGVWERNERAKTFYLRWGFEKVGEHDFMLGSDHQRDWVMARRL